MSIRLNHPLWDKARRADLYSKALWEIGLDAIKDVQENIDNSIPAGRTYRRGAITRKASKRNAVKGLRMTKGGTHRIVGSKFHKASKFGQAPAKDTKRLYRSNKIKRLSAFRVRVYNDTPYAEYLDPPAKLNRPFFRPVIQKNRPKYMAKARQRLLALANNGAT